MSSASAWDWLRPITLGTTPGTTPGPDFDPGGGFFPLLTSMVTALPSSSEAPAAGSWVTTTPTGSVAGTSFTTVVKLASARIFVASSTFFPTTSGTVPTAAAGGFGKSFTGNPSTAL